MGKAEKGGGEDKKEIKVRGENEDHNKEGL